MSLRSLHLIKNRRFLPMLLTQACGCFNDNLLKSALIMLINYKANFYSDLSPPMLVALANSIFVFPRLIFSSLSGQLADKFDKAKIVQIIKAIEIVIIGISIYGFYAHNLIILFISLALMGIHSTFFGPIKYSILPEHLVKNELLAANSYIESTTFLTILIGALVGGIAVNGIGIVLIIMIMIGILGFIASLYILPSTHKDPSIVINWNIVQETYLLVRNTMGKKQVF